MGSQHRRSPNLKKVKKKPKVLLSFGITNLSAKRNQNSDKTPRHSAKKIIFPKLKGGGKKPKVLLTDDKEIEHELTFLRSLDFLTEAGDHKKCELSKFDVKNNLCDFCLLRSIVIRSRNSKGRTKIKPVEFLCIKNTNLRVICQFLEDASPKLSDKIMNDWGCATCSIVDKDIYLDFSHDSRCEGKDLYRLLKCWEDIYNRKHAGHENRNHMEAEVLLFRCDYGISINLTSNLEFLGKEWRCKSFVTEDRSYFYSDEKYYFVENNEVELWNERNINDVVIVALEVTNRKQEDMDETLSYNREEIIKLYDVIRTEDRHLKKDDRHLKKDDRHLKKNRVYNDEKDRHIKKNRVYNDQKDRHLDKKNRQKNRKLVESLKNETGMDIICSVCFEYKSSTSCSRLDFEPREKIQKFAVEESFTKNIDGFFYICTLCKTSIKKGQEPIRAQGELFGLLDFPNKFKEKLLDACQPVKNKENFFELNKVEDFILKLVIPFIRIGHLTRGPYLKVKGSLVMISSDIVQSMNSILPLPQVGSSNFRKLTNQKST